jgi:twitching motility two-component system response regulator PilG
MDPVMSNQSSPMTEMLYQPLDIPAILTQGVQERRTGYFAIDHDSVTWFCYFYRGALIYITHSADPADRVDTRLRALSNQFPEITAEIRTLTRTVIELNQNAHPKSDYQAICELLRRSILTQQQASEVLQGLSQGALESLLLIREGNCLFWPKELRLPILSPLEISELLQESYRRLKAWQKFAPLVWSPYQRPYLIAHSASLQRLPPEQQKSLAKILRGFSFRHLGILLKQDELLLVQRLFPLIQDKTILLREPQAPFDQLPRFSSDFIIPQEVPVESTSSPEPNPAELAHWGTQRQFKIACIDDSPTILQTLERFLGAENLVVKVIHDSVVALLEIMRFKPDLVLMDVGMPQVDGYELCRLIRRHSQFKTIPIIMVTGNTGLIDRAKAKLAGATDYMTKPFNQDELLKMVFRYLD